LSERSQTLEAYERLKFDMLNGFFSPSTKLKIDALSTTLNVSPGAVREALSRLTSDGLVEALPQRGFKTAALSLDELKDLTAVRIEIETRCLRSAMANGDVAWEGLVLSTCHQLSKMPLHVPVGDGQGYNPEWGKLHMSFHEVLVSACDSPWWLKLREQLYIHAERYRCLHGARRPHEVGRDIDDEHQTLAQAVVARDDERATRLMSDHLQRTADIIIKAGLL
jgi:GntR family transcriptional regulator, carbon starvation induced regulator